MSRPRRWPRNVPTPAECRERMLALMRQLDDAQLDLLVGNVQMLQELREIVERERAERERAGVIDLAPRRLRRLRVLRVLRGAP